MTTTGLHLRDATQRLEDDALPMSRPALRQQRIAVIVPCLNEEAAIEKVVKDFRKALATAAIYVYDNGSTDETVRVAREAGAIVRSEPLKGKGNVVRRMFADVDADVYVLVDGDDTYDASKAGELVEKLLKEQLDMVNGARIEKAVEAYRPGHRLGNAVLTGMVAYIFGDRLKDLLSGYRVLSRRFVKSFPALSAGFETETEITVHALELRMPIAEVETPYKERPAGSASKLRTFRDGFRILRTIIILLKEQRPLAFFSSIFGVLAVASIVLVIPVFETYSETGLVPRFPTAILATGMMLLAFLSLTSGMVLDSVARGRQEQKRLRYLMIDAPSPAAEDRHV
ncbi:MAG TPA: glycosyltransferase family 2 protein [Polyangiaceae bacterium]|nr:glycosyltransferase family 2 protein [Polyangiaceae bacterium]